MKFHLLVSHGLSCDVPLFTGEFDVACLGYWPVELFFSSKCCYLQHSQ